jgi:hypothetical protein
LAPPLLPPALLVRNQAGLRHGLKAGLKAGFPAFFVFQTAVTSPQTKTPLARGSVVLSSRADQ